MVQIITDSAADFEPQELEQLGYGDRVDAYLEEYGEGRENND